MLPESEPREISPRTAPSVLSFVGWDGALPLAVVAAQFISRMLLVGADAAMIASIIVAPIIAALIRAQVGYQQIAENCGGTAPAWRQIALALAIALLLAFEILWGALAAADGAPAAAWIVPVGCYLAYLVMIVLALRPSGDTA